MNHAPILIMIRGWPAVLAPVFLVAMGGTALGGTASSDKGVSVPDCVTVRSAARKTGYGFDHVVYVRNACPVAVGYMVATSVDPKPRLDLIVQPGRENGVITRTDAKSRTFKPWVSCELRAKAERIERDMSRLAVLRSRGND